MKVKEEWKLAEDQKKEIVKGLWKLLKKKRMKIKRKIQEMKRIEKREESVPGGYIPAVETKQRECWKFLDSRLNSDP